MYLTTKPGSAISDEDMAEYLDVLAVELRLIQEDMGDRCYFEDFGQKLIITEKDLRHFFRDDDAVLVRLDEEDIDLPQAFGSVRKVSPTHIFVHQVTVKDFSRKAELIPIILQHIRVMYPDKIAYGLVHSSNKRMDKYLKSIGSTRCDLMFASEHPYFTEEDGWTSFEQKIEGLRHP